MTQRASWMVHSTLDEPLELIVAFVAHYLELGADLVHLCLDRDRPDVMAVLGRHDRVQLTICDDDYWADGGIDRPELITVRQRMNARAALIDLEHDWMLFCDADEFLVPPCDFGQFLARQPEDTEFLRINVAERVLPENTQQEKIFDGIFRIAVHSRHSRQLGDIYGKDIVPLLVRGLAADTLGKSVIRRNANLDIALHYPVPWGIALEDRAKLLTTPPWQTWAKDCYLIHFDGLTPRHYLLKLLMKYVYEPDILTVRAKFFAPTRVAQIAAIAAALTDPAAADRLRALHWLSPEIIAQLREIDGMADIQIDPESSVMRQFPELHYDYSAANFNKALDELHKDLIMHTGFSL